MTLADRIEGLEYFKCPLCGDGDFDIGGFLTSHLEGPHGCPVAWAYYTTTGSNAEVAAALRAREASNG